MNKKETIETAVRSILECIGEDTNRPGLEGTPDRIARMVEELFRGYDPQHKPNITTFNNSEDGIECSSIVLDSGDFYSMCEHHMMPFFGHYWFAYVPNPQGRILGLSKVGRVVDYCAAKLQLQERLTKEIVEMLADALGGDYPPLGMALVLEGEHLCKSMRGARKKGVMRTAHLTGCFKSDEAFRK